MPQRDSISHSNENWKHPLKKSEALQSTRRAVFTFAKAAVPQPIVLVASTRDGAACRLGELGDVHDELGVLGGDRVVQIVLRVLGSW